jgi:hypothetical protein
MNTKVIIFPKQPSVLEGEIRCYRRSSLMSYEVFLLFDDGSSWTSGYVGSWNEALRIARSETSEHHCPGMFSA